MNIENLISVYAALLSSILLIWELFKYFHDRRSKMMVKGRLADSLPIDHMGRPMKWTKYFFIEVINRGNYPRYIYKPGLIGNKKDNKYLSMLDINEAKKYPYLLSPGEVYTYHFEYSELSEALEKGITKLRVHVTDTNGKTYRSKWINLV
jgi:hypothetical protein